MTHRSYGGGPVQHALKIAIHIAVALAAYVGAYAFVLSPALDWWISDAARQFWLLAILYATLAAMLELVFRTERSSWRYVSVQDGFALLRSTFLTCRTSSVNGPDRTTTRRSPPSATTSRAAFRSP